MAEYIEREAAIEAIMGQQKGNVIMTDREKLIDLMIQAKIKDPEDAPFSEFLADFLIASGVTFGKETDGYFEKKEATDG